MHTVTSRVYRPTIVGAVLALFFSLVFIAAPAQAATLTFSSNQPTIELGQSFTLTWDAGETTGVQASGDWSGAKGDAGNQSITPTDTGSYTYTLTASDAEGPAEVKSVTVRVDPAALPAVTPGAVTFPGGCTVIIPDTAGVIYSVTIDGSTDEIEPGSYDGTEFDGDSAAVFTAAADDGHVIAGDSTTSWTYTPGDECFEDGGNAELVTTKTACSAVTFTNITEATVVVAYGSFDNDDEDGDITLAPGASKTVKTTRGTLDFGAIAADEELVQIDSVKVPQNCGSNASDPKPTKPWPIKHRPTVAPAAGVTGNSDGPTSPFLVLLGIATLIAVRRAYSFGR